MPEAPQLSGVRGVKVRVSCSFMTAALLLCYNDAGGKKTPVREERRASCAPTGETQRQRSHHESLKS